MTKASKTNPSGKSGKSVAGLLICVILLVLSELIPLPEGITRIGILSLALFFSAVILWICDSMPMCVTAFLIMFLMPLFGVMDLNTVFSSFGGSAFFFAIATFFMSIALEDTSVPLRICYALTKGTKGNSRKLVIALMFACALTSSVMSNLSSCIIYLGLATALLHANNCKPLESNLGKCLMIGLPAMAGCGGLITPAGTPGNILIIDLLQTQGITLTFLQWTIIFGPLALLTTAIAGLWITHIFKPEKIEPAAIEALENRLKESGSLKPQEKKTLFIIICMLICWFLGTWIPAMNITIVAIIGMAVMFLPGVNILSWDHAVKRTNWNLAFTIGSVGVLISGMTSTGIMDWIVTRIFANITGLNLFLMFFIIGLVVCIIRAFIPTAPAIVALFGPPLLSLVALTGATPTALLILPAFWACTPMLLWIEPIYLFSYGNRYYKPLDVLRFGWFPSLVMTGVMSFIPLYCTLFGL